jgi:hypothetical protein
VSGRGRERSYSLHSRCTKHEVAQLLAELDFFVGAVLIPTPDGASPFQEDGAEGLRARFRVQCWLIDRR